MALYSSSQVSHTSRQKPGCNSPHLRYPRSAGLTNDGAALCLSLLQKVRQSGGHRLVQRRLFGPPPLSLGSAVAGRGWMRARQPRIIGRSRSVSAQVKDDLGVFGESEPVEVVVRGGAE